jgi:hypothetical protein
MPTPLSKEEDDDSPAAIADTLHEAVVILIGLIVMAMVLNFFSAEQRNVDLNL